jgi:TRAP-type C4-dicarboxylate transport system permease small subunit
MKTTITVGAMISVVLLMLLAIVPLAWWGGYWMQYLWTWFIMPTFGIPVPNVWILAGLILVGRVMTRPTSHHKDKELSDHLIEFGVTGVVGPPLVTAFGWIFYQLAQ